MVKPRKLLANLMYAAGIWRVYRAGASVITYHGVIDETRTPWLEAEFLPVGEFRAHLDFLRRHRAVVSLDEILSCVSVGRSPDPRLVVLCFDDALACLVDLVVPELVARKMPFTLGVPSGLANTGRSIWEFEIAFLIYLLDARKKLHDLVDMLHQVSSDLGRPTLLLGREDSPARILAEFNRFLRDDIPSDRRIAVLDGLVTELQPDLRERLRADGRFCILRWEQLRELCSVGGYLAAHGSLHHPHNATISEPCRLSELLQPLEAITRHTGTATECFIWPEGFSSPSSIRLGKDLGYKYFFSTRAGLITRDTSPFDMPRVSGQWPLPQLLWNAAGLE